MANIKSARGETVEIDKLVLQNGGTVALGNANMNARGDILGPGGVIVKTREQQLAEYYDKNPNAVEKVDLRMTHMDEPEIQEPVVTPKKKADEKIEFKE